MLVGSLKPFSLHPQEIGLECTIFEKEEDIGGVLRQKLGTSGGGTRGHGAWWEALEAVKGLSMFQRFDGTQEMS